MEYNKILLLVYLALIVLNSFIAIIMYANDKKKAQKGQMRTKEKNLLMISVLNGGIGSFIGRKIAHHKTDKKYFSFTIYTSILFQVIVGAVLAYLALV